MPNSDAASTARGWTAGAGWVPALRPGWPVSSFHSAAANWERAELWTHTNSTQRAPSTGLATRPRQAVGAERDVSPPPVALGGTAFDQAGAFQNLQVMCQEVPLDTGDPSEFFHSQITQRQSVHHRQPDRIAQRGVETGAFFQSRHLAQNLLIQNLLINIRGRKYYSTEYRFCGEPLLA